MMPRHFVYLYSFFLHFNRPAIRVGGCCYGSVAEFRRMVDGSVYTDVLSNGSG